MRRTLILLPLLSVAVIAATILLVSNMTRAVQNATMSFDMDTAGNTYTPGDDVAPADGFPDAGTNHMTIGTIENCLTTAPPGSTVTHSHVVHLLIQNVEDMVGWQGRLNFVGDHMRVQGFNAAPFTDTFTGGVVGFATLPLDGSGVHRDFVPASSIPAAPPDGSNTSQTALIGGVYNGAQDFGLSPDTPQKPVHDETNQTYGTTGGGILATVTLQVLGDESGQASLFMNLDDGNPAPPESNVQVFNGTGLVAMPIPVTQLGDAYHGEGATCVALECVTTECPVPPPTPTPPPTATPGPPTPTATATPPATATSTAGPATATPVGGAATPTRTATPAGGATTPTRTATPRASPAALPPTGTTSNDDSVGLPYLILLIAGLVVPASGAAFALWRLRRNGWL